MSSASAAVALMAGVVAETEIIVIGEGDEALAARRSVLAGLVDGHEEGVVLGEVGAASEAKALVGEIGEALLLVHVSVSSVCSSTDCPAARRKIMTFVRLGEGYHLETAGQAHERHAHRNPLRRPPRNTCFLR